MKERELLLTGIGGQGVQLAAHVVAGAAALEGRNVMLFGVYAGVMRGGSSDATVVVADGPVQAPPIVSHAWSALVLHPRYDKHSRTEAGVMGMEVHQVFGTWMSWATCS